MEERLQSLSNATCHTKQSEASKRDKVEEIIYFVQDKQEDISLRFLIPRISGFAISITIQDFLFRSLCLSKFNRSI